MMKQTTQTDAARGIAFFSDSKRAVANLMAKERISIQVVQGAPTASFDPANRVLVIPAWTNLTVEQTDLLMSHEIGHALFSDVTVFEKIAAENPNFFSYVNIVEDARIERKVRNSFPGIGRVFYNGYHQFHTDGPILKGDKTSLINPKTGEPRDIASMKLIDRINLYYKIGAFCTVPFAESEKIWIAKIDKCADTDQAIAIAKALYELAKDEQSKQDSKPQPQPQQEQKAGKGQKQEASQQQPSDEQEAGDSTDESQESEESEGDESKEEASKGDESEEGDESGASTGDQSDDESEESDESESDEAGDQTDDAPEASQPSNGPVEAAETVQDIEETLRGLVQAEDSARNQITHLLLAPLPDAVTKNRTLSADAWSEDAMKVLNGALVQNMQQDLDTLNAAWNAQFLSTAQHMALEFERRKNAKALQNAKTAKTGKLNLSKLHAYKFTEDLFMRSVAVPNGKSHGVVMLIDGSGSMSGGFANVMDQVLLFAHFAHQVNIPFEAYMFTNSGPGGYSYRRQNDVMEHSEGLHQVNLSPDGILVGLINTATGGANFKRQVRVVLALREMYMADGNENVSYETKRAFQAIPYVHLGGTPLFTGMLLAERAIERMKRVARLDKMTFLLVTDGEDNSNLYYRKNGLDYKGVMSVNTARVSDGPCVMRDTVTKQNFMAVEERLGYYGRKELGLPSNGIFQVLMDVIKARHDARTAAIYIQTGSLVNRRRRRSRMTESVDGVTSLLRAGLDMTTANITIEAVRTSMTADGQYVIPTVQGVADVCIVLKGSSLRLTENDFEKLDTTTLTQKKVAKAFTSAMVKNVANRKFTATIIPFLQ